MKNSQASNKSFGYFFSVIFILLYYYIDSSSGYIENIFLLLSILLIIVTILSPDFLEKPSYVWYKFGLFLNKIISPITLGVIFYLVVTPVGFIVKFLNYDPLRLKKNNKADTYWISVNKNKTTMSDFL